MSAIRVIDVDGCYGKFQFEVYERSVRCIKPFVSSCMLSSQNLRHAPQEADRIIKDILEIYNKGRVSKSREIGTLLKELLHA